MDFSWLTGKGNKKVYYIITIGILALVFLIVSSLGNGAENRKQKNLILPDSHKDEDGEFNSAINSNPEELEEKLKVVLNEINGVGEVSVMVKYVSSPEMVYAYNTTKENKVTEENDTSGGKRIINEQRDANNLVIIQDAGSTSDQPVIIKKIEPEISGVLVVAEGAEIAAVRAQLVKAVQTVLNIPSYKINVLPKGR